MNKLHSVILLLVGAALGAAIPSAFASSAGGEKASGQTLAKSTLCSTAVDGVWISTSVVSTASGDRLMVTSFLDTFEEPNAWVVCRPLEAEGSETVVETKWGDLTITPSNGSWASFDPGVREHRISAELSE